MKVLFESSQSPSSTDAFARAQLSALSREGKPWVDVLNMADALRLPHVLKHSILAGLITEQSNNFSCDTISPIAGGAAAAGVRAALNALADSGDAITAAPTPSPPFTSIPFRVSSPLPVDKKLSHLSAPATLPTNPPFPASPPPTTGMLFAAATATAAAQGRATSPLDSSFLPPKVISSATSSSSSVSIEPPSRREMMQRLSRERLGLEVHDLYRDVVSPALVPTTPINGFNPTRPVTPPDARDYTNFLSPRSLAAAVAGTAFATLHRPQAPIDPPVSSASQEDSSGSASYKTNSDFPTSPRSKSDGLRVPVTIESEDDEQPEGGREKPAVQPWPSWVTEGTARSVRVRLSSGDGSSGRTRSASDALPRTTVVAGGGGGVHHPCNAKSTTSPPLLLTPGRKTRVILLMSITVLSFLRTH